MEVRSMMRAAGAMTAVGVLLVGSASGVSFVEGADVASTKAAATIIPNWGSGETITGAISSSTDFDMYRVSAPVSAPGIYRHRIDLSGTAGGRYSTRGTTAFSAVPTDVNFMSDRLSGESLVWYSFGNAGEMYLRAGRSGTGSNTYTMTQTITAVTSVPAGSITPGSHTLTSVLVGDSEIYLYDSSFNLLGQNDSQAGGDVRASMVYTFATPGVYYIAIGSGNSSTNVGAVSVPAYSSNPADPFYDSSVGAGARSVILDFPNVIARPENLARTAAEFALKIDSGTKILATGGVGGQELAWFVVQVRAACAADFNNSGMVSVQDIFDFLTAYFSSDPRADINASGAVSVQDIFDFLALYFAGCP